MPLPRYQRCPFCNRPTETKNDMARHINFMHRDEEAYVWMPEYEKWRHGGWYVINMAYPSRAIGCVSKNYADGKWRIVCHPASFEEQPTFKTRDEAARAERELAAELVLA